LQLGLQFVNPFLIERVLVLFFIAHPVPAAASQYEMPHG